MRFALVGDIHATFAKADALVRRHVGPVDAIFSVGDAEPNRTATDSLGVGGPAKHRKVGDFPQYAAGHRTMSAPVHFIGGNHEPWPALDAQGPGEWAPGFHFLGRSGVAQVAGLQVAFLSGIYSRHFSEPEEPPPITPERLKEYGYFTRPHVERLLDQAQGRRIDLLITHEWPSGLSYLHHGRIPVGRDDIRALTDLLAPQVHVCGHMHAPFRERVGATQVICLSQVLQGADAVAALELAPDGTLAEVPLAGAGAAPVSR
ncbi:metallophosphoesterase [Nonomuraea sp. NPDC005983]|uniref:metallophosphoesterase n=1 Tax=Nonomuraea sp. NPDC005983 TaxID=3155595 RepID=UPI0033B7F0EA